MCLNKVLLIVVGAIISLQLCECNGNESKKNSTNNVIHQPSDASGGNITDDTKNWNSSESTTMTSTLKSDIKIIHQKYIQNTSGEYRHEVLFSNGNWRAERGEYEDRDGTVVFVVRGVFSYHTKEGTYNTTLYIVDEFGYHNVEPPPQLSTHESGAVDYRPDVETTSDCGGFKGSYCIDPKLLALMVG